MNGILCAAILAAGVARAQDQAADNSTIDLRLRIVSSLPGSHHAVPAVAWLEAQPGTPALPFVSRDHYTLLQKHRTFIPHLQVIPVGSAVQFPNADPFYHNVFSLFEGKRFDLGLYEAGSSKSVTFSRQGVSYIFCNIHPEMSAVILALNTPLYGVADSHNSIVLRGVPAGDYRLRVWIEGVPQSFLEGLGRTVHVSKHDQDLGTVSAPIAGSMNMTHTNKFGNPYDTNPNSTY
jgi:plastocyanin